MKVLANLDFARNQALNMVVQVLATAPASPQIGLFYYDSTLLTLRSYNGSTWTNLDATKTTGIPLSSLATDPLARANHTGTQLAATISNLATTVQGYSLSSFAVPTADVSLNNRKITNLAEPTLSSDAATKNYVDNSVSNSAAGIDNKPSVRVATTANIALTGLTAIDGVTPAAGNRILVKDQTNATQNGVYVAASSAWARATDADATGEITPGAFWYVEEGTTQGATQWRVSNTGTVTLGTTPITINQFGGAATPYTAGNGLSLTGNQFASVAAPGSGLTVGPSGIGTDASVARIYGQAVGDGTASSFTITHNLNNARPLVQVWEVATNSLVIVDTVAASVNTVSINFGSVPAANSYYVSVFG